jgi:Na+-driven multidrug efflux pump
MLIIGGMLGFDVFFWWAFIHSNSSILFKVILVISIFVLFVYMMVLVNVFALIGIYENPTKVQLKNAIIIGINKFPQTLIIIFIYAVCLGMISAMMFQGVGKGVTSFILTFIRALLLEVVFSYLFGIVFNMGEYGIYYGVILGGFIGGLISFTWATFYIKRLIRNFNN